AVSSRCMNGESSTMRTLIAMSDEEIRGLRLPTRVEAFRVELLAHHHRVVAQRPEPLEEHAAGTREEIDLARLFAPEIAGDDGNLLALEVIDGERGIARSHVGHARDDASRAEHLRLDALAAR